jgi:thiol-disulfide isomerase/thioredoxin
MTSLLREAVVAAGILSLLTACGSGFGRAAAPGSGSSTTVGLTVFEPAQRSSLPAVSGTTLNGRPLDVRSYAHHSPLVVNVWASWCAPCRLEVPLLARASHRGVRVLGIDEKDSASRARSFARSRGATYPSLLDPQGRVLADLRMLPQAGIPSTLVITADGLVAARIVGPLTPTSLRQALAEANRDH